MKFMLGLLFVFVTANSIAQVGDNSYLPVAGDKYVSFGVNEQTGTIYYRKFKENTFSQWGIGGSINVSTTPDANYYYSNYRKSEGTDLSYSYFDANPMLTYGKARRVKITERMETFVGLNYSFGAQFSSVKENHTLVDSTKLLNWYGPFSTYNSYNNDHYNRNSNNIRIRGSISPFLGANYFITEKLGIGAYFSFSGFSLLLPVSGREEIDIKEKGIVNPKKSVSHVQPGIGASLNFYGSGGILITYSLK